MIAQNFVYTLYYDNTVRILLDPSLSLRLTYTVHTRASIIADESSSNRFILSK